MLAMQNMLHGWMLEDLVGCMVVLVYHTHLNYFVLCVKLEQLQMTYGESAWSSWSSAALRLTLSMLVFLWFMALRLDAMVGVEEIKSTDEGSTTLFKHGQHLCKTSFIMEAV